MGRVLWQTRTLYGVAAMAASMLVFSYLQEREEQEGREQEAAEQHISSSQFFQAVDALTLTTQQKIEVRKFWRNLCKRKIVEQRAAAASEASDRRQTIDDNTAVSKAVTEQRTGSEPLSLHVWEIQEFAREYKEVFPETFPEELVLEATRRAAESAIQVVGLVGSTSSMIRSTGKRFQDIAKDTKDEMQGAVHRTVRRYLESALDVVADRLKSTVKDPYMPAYLQSNIDLAVDQFMPDVKVEIFRKTRELFTVESSASRPNQMIEAPSTRTVEELSWPRRVRGHILYHLFPHDKTIWRCFRDPWWVFYSCVGVLPYFGQLWWLFLFLIKDKTNEHQLCQFIVGFKVAQFISLGLASTAFGVLAYVRCIVRGTLEICRDNGPSLEPWNAFFFLLQIALVWAAFFRLPYTERPSERRHPLLYRTSSMERREKRVYRDIFGNRLHLNRGGYLMKLSGYETISFALILAATCVILWVPFDPWQRKALFYWLRTAYGLCSFPFIMFKVPLLANVLMHTRRMGYNEYGDTVRVVKPRQD
ncbi:hypothetical protein PINS_up003943 [Pythium insidiosum]|nr:hypothetical protein PINS_up003943 [Pythium insidiosum]